jgi:SAM-dependent methyltransferase
MCARRWACTMAEAPGAASHWVMAGLKCLPRGAQVLDFACGRGRHALAALRLGLSVVAADRDAGALQAIESLWLADRSEREPSGSATEPRLATVCADLEAEPWPFEPARFDAIVVCNYLFRPRLDGLPDLLRPGGLLIYETFAEGNERYGRPANPDYLLARGELFAWVVRTGLHGLAFEDGFVGGSRRARVQRVRALRPPADLEAFALE